jgi:hypothetical protein
MVTIIEQPQDREQTATQRKIDQLLRASPHGESCLIMPEEESDETIQVVEKGQRRPRASGSCREVSRKGEPLKRLTRHGLGHQRFWLDDDAHQGSRFRQRTRLGRGYGRPAWHRGSAAES